MEWKKKNFHKLGTVHVPLLPHFHSQINPMDQATRTATDKVPFRTSRTETNRWLQQDCQIAYQVVVFILSPVRRKLST